MKKLKIDLGNRVTSFQWHKFSDLITGVGLAWTTYPTVAFKVHFFPVGNPARDSADSEHNREHVQRNTDRSIRDPGVDKERELVNMKRQPNSCKKQLMEAQPPDKNGRLGLVNTAIDYINKRYSPIHNSYECPPEQGENLGLLLFKY